MKHKYLVLYEKSYMKNRGITDRCLQHGTFKRQEYRQGFKDAPMETTKEGTQIRRDYLMNLQGVDLTGYDGLIVMLDGDRLKGRHGVHFKMTRNSRPFSLIQTECHRGYVRCWKQKKDKTWELEMVRKRRGDYDQIEYTFEHELGHSKAFLSGKPDTLHTFVQHRAYELWWTVNKF